MSRDVKLIEKKINSFGIQYHHSDKDSSFVLLCRRSDAHKHIARIQEYAFDTKINIRVGDIEKRPLIIVMSGEE